jgi:hypothetical protein
MNRYPSSTPRTAFGITAIALTALTIGLAVVVPARMSPGYPAVGTVLAAQAVAPAATEVAIIPGRITVIGVRESTVAAGSPTATPAKRS